MAGIFEPLTISGITLRNRFIRSATLENLGKHGLVTDKLVSVYRELAKGGIGLIITGGLFPEKEGQLFPGQLGADSDASIPGLKKLTKVVHKHGGTIIAQLLHAGWNCRPEVNGSEPKGPTALVNPHSGLHVRELSSEEISNLVKAFAQAARRTRDAGFDGVQLHAAHSHLISSFLSPFCNRRLDEWGGSAKKRYVFISRICEETRELVGDDYPILAKLGVVDYHPDGKSLPEGVNTAAMMEADGIRAIEISEGIEPSRAHHIRLKARRPIYINECREVRAAVSVPLFLVGGFRTLSDMERIIREGIADAISMCRPFILDPNVVTRFREGSLKRSLCTSCNRCLESAAAGRFGCARLRNMGLNRGEDSP